jgi:RHS repeat-associated protein
VAELDGTANVVSRFVYATGINVPDYMVRGDSTYRLIRDHLGSVRLVVNVQSGTIAQQIAYDEFGVETQNSNPGFQPFGFAGGLADAQTGLVRFGARDYQPGAGRWTAKDPSLFRGGLLSLYEYAAGDPVNAVDLEGLRVFFVHGTWSDANQAFPKDFRERVLAYYGETSARYVSWPGGLNDADRRKGAEYLAEYIRAARRANPCEPIIVVAHSHGGNVALLASHMEGVRIDELVTLGTPIMEKYQPGDGLDGWTNVYSNSDHVQSSAPGYGRRSDTAFNIRIRGFGHGDLHTVAAWNAAFGEGNLP